MEEVVWGIIGVGDVTEVKSGPAFGKVNQSRIARVMRRNLARAKDYAERHGVPAYTDDVDDLLHDPDINAIYIATPPASHCEYAIQAAESKRHVYVEKPMATRYAACLDMIESCRANDVKLFVAYYRRELAYFKKIKQLVEEDVIGEVKFVDIKLLFPPNKEDYQRDNLPWRVVPEVAGAGYFYDLASHQFDFLDFLLGPVESATGTSSNQLNLYDAEDIVTASFRFQTNVMGSATWCFTMENGDRVDRTELVGSKGKIVFSFFEPRPIEIVTSGQPSTLSIDYPPHVQQPLIDTIVKDILGEGNCVSTGDSGARTNWVLDQILGR